ncbi:hypothetical protein SH661x_002717 [Planctomicrobium sp. SH661]|uniref:hypothetical protein n=1 Tax=Planctomicrobium sp. SH661 TaxID=3448124 RepID=UPI003F5CA91E
MGCFGYRADSLPNIVPVSGTVTYNGKPLDHGTVMFTPEDIVNGNSATGDIVDGKFTMATTASSPGVQIGKYKVAIVCTELHYPPQPVDPEKVKEIKIVPFKPLKSLIPERFTRVDTSQLEVEVVKGMERLTYDLKD